MVFFCVCLLDVSLYSFFGVDFISLFSRSILHSVLYLKQSLERNTRFPNILLMKVTVCFSNEDFVAMDTTSQRSLFDKTYIKSLKGR